MIESDGRWQGQIQLGSQERMAKKCELTSLCQERRSEGKMREHSISAEGTKDALLIAGWLLGSYSECHFRSKLSSVGRASIDAQNSSHVGMTGKSFHPHILTSGPFPLEAVLLCHGWLCAYTCVWMCNFMYSREWQRRHFLLVSSAASSLLPG